MSWIAITALAVVVLLAAVVIVPAVFGSPWHPLRRKSIRRILEFAEISPGQKIIDLGSGDGRLLVAAAKECQALGEGWEIDPIKVMVSRIWVRLAGVHSQVQIHWRNMYQYDECDADVVYVYLTHQALDKLFPEKLKNLKPTAKIVSFRFCLKGRKPDKVDPAGDLFLYRLDRGRSVDHRA